MHVTLRIETRTIIRFIATLAVFGALVLMFFKLSSMLMIFAIAFFLAIALNPPVSKISGFLPRHSRIAATAIAYVFVLAVLGTLVYVAAPPVISQTSSFVSNFPAYVGSLADKQNSFSGVIEQYNLQGDIDNAIEQAQSEASAIAGGIGSSFISGVSSILTGTITMLTILVLTFLMLIEGPSWMRQFWSLYSHKNKLARDQRLVTKMYRVITGYVNGQVTVAAIAAASVFVFLLVLSRIFAEVPLGAIVPLTGVAFIATLIPLFGATIATILITLVLLFNSIPAAIIFLLFFLIYQQIENNIIQPVVQSRTMQLSALGVFSAAIVGIALLGIVGALLAIPIAGCIRVLIVDFLKHKQDYTHHLQHDGRLVTLGAKGHKVEGQKSKA